MSSNSAAPDIEAAADSDSLGERAYKAIEEAIVTLELAPGTSVSEVQLSRRFGLGRSPVRSALQRLAAEGMVLILPRRGIMVSQIDVRSQVKLVETRREVERLVACYAAIKAASGDRQRFREIGEEMEAAASANAVQAFLRLDAEFYDLALNAARNEWAAKCIRLMQPISRRFWYYHFQHADDLGTAAHRQAELVRAIASGDAEQAKAACEARCDYVERMTRNTLLD